MQLWVGGVSMSLTWDDKLRVSPLPEMLLQELVSMQARCSQLEQQLRYAERSRDESMERLYDLEQARDSKGECRIVHGRSEGEEQGAKGKRRYQRLNLVLSFA